MRDRQLLNAEEIGRLLYLEMVDELTPSERAMLNEWRYQQNPKTLKFFEEIRDWEQIERDLRRMYAANAEAAFDKVQERIEVDAQTFRDLQEQIARAEAAEAAEAAEDSVAPMPSRGLRVIMGRRRVRFAAAAVLLVFITGLAYTYYVLKNSSSSVTNAAISPKAHYKSDVAPGGDKAILTLADGRQLTLDHASQGKLAQQGGTAVVLRAPGQVAYNVHPVSGHSTPDELINYNMISTPRGGTYQVLLPDGSKVWLNAASSLRFPTVFAGRERKVELTGEAYFEITKDQARPFKVSMAAPSSSGGGAPEASQPMEIEVLGTEFNVMAYPGEGGRKATLLNGAIKVVSGKDATVLQPGQQAIAAASAPLHVISDVNTEEVVAWKNGSFVFASATLDEILRQLSRWYDVDVKYEGAIPTQRLSANMSRSNNLSDILKVLELSGYRFDIDGKNIVVKK